MLAARARAIGVPVLRPSPWADGLARVESGVAGSGDSTASCLVRTTRNVLRPAVGTEPVRIREPPGDSGIVLAVADRDLTSRKFDGQGRVIVYMQWCRAT